jgi:hypothetical protein
MERVRLFQTFWILHSGEFARIAILRRTCAQSRENSTNDGNSSGHLNAKQRELLEMQAKAQARLAKARARFAEGLQDAREVRADLEWTQKKVS